MTAGDLKKTPLNEWHRANGAQMVDFGGWDMPVQYRAGILQEHLATRKFGGLFDVSHMGRLRIKGANRIPFLQHVLSNNAEALEPCQAHYTLIPNENGGLIDDAYLYRFFEDDYLVVVNASNRDRVWIHFQEQVKYFKDVIIEDQTENVAMIAFQGPLSRRILETLIEGGALPEPFRNRLSEITLSGAKILVARTGYTGEPLGFELFVPAKRAEKVWHKLYQAGNDRGVLAVGLGARDTLRLEAGMPLYGHEFGLDPEGKEFPAFCFPSAGIAVSFSERKGSYIGRDALARQFEQFQKLQKGLCEPSKILPRQIRSLSLLDKGVIRQGDEVFIGNKKVGVVTSGTITPYWKFEGEGANMQITDKNDRRAIALAYLDGMLLPDRQVDVVVRGRRLRAEIVQWHGRSDAPPYFHPIPVDWKMPESKSALEKGMEKVKFLFKKNLENHNWRQRCCINLIPSEMTPSPLVRLLQVSDPVGRYAEHKELIAAFDQEVFYYQGTDFIAWVEDRLAAEMTDRDDGFPGMSSRRNPSHQRANGQHDDFQCLCGLQEPNRPSTRVQTYQPRHE